VGPHAAAPRSPPQPPAAPGQHQAKANTGNKNELRHDIENEIGTNSSIFPQGSLDCLSQRLWNDVQRIMAEAEANE
jgi:hypothetical protein